MQKEKNTLVTPAPPPTPSPPTKHTHGPSAFPATPGRKALGMQRWVGEYKGRGGGGRYAVQYADLRLVAQGHQRGKEMQQGANLHAFGNFKLALSGELVQSKPFTVLVMAHNS